MIRARFGLARILVLLLSLGAVALAFTFTSRYRASLERGNRLYHEGRVEDASELYRTRVEADIPEGDVAYNLGTALLALDSPEAEEYLRFSTELYDSAAVQRGHYNLTRMFLLRAGAAPDAQVAIAQLAGAVTSGRVALRLAPDDEDARWNLALAQFVLDSLMREIAPPETEVAEEPERSEGGLVIPEIARRNVPQGRELEAIAGEDPGSLAIAEVEVLLEGVGTDVEALIRAVLWSRRPDVQTWEDSYPGGAW